MVRSATVEDIPNVLRMGYEFWKICGATHIPYDEESVRELLLKLIESDDGLLLIADDVGMTGALVYPSYLNKQFITGQELFWWIDPEHRKSKLGLEMYLALEEWAKSKANSFTMIALAESEPDRIGKFYMDNGYKPLEIHFTKVL